VYYVFNTTRGEPDHVWCYSLDYQHRFIPMAGSIKSILNAVVVIAITLWLLGLISSYAFGGCIHILLVIAIIVLVI
jgi:hypothetical protein